MKLEDLTDLYYITPISNVPSILEHGILSHKKAKQITHDSIAMNEIQERRAKRIVPNGLPLHEYANIYFCARNPMMFKRRHNHKNICVLGIDFEVIKLDDAVIADGNASSGYSAFGKYPLGLSKIDYELVFAESWTDPDLIIEWKKKRIKCAEVLLPNYINPKYIIRCYVSCRESQNKIVEIGCRLPIIFEPKMFFQ